MSLHNQINLAPAAYSWAENVLFVPINFGLTEENMHRCGVQQSTLNLAIDIVEEEGILFEFAALRQFERLVEDACLEGKFYPIPAQIKEVATAMIYVEQNDIDIL